MRCTTPTLATVVVAAVLAAAPGTASAQGIRGLGFYAGSVESRQIRPRNDDSDPRPGVEAGVFVDVQIARSSWSILAEAGYVERGGRYPNAESDAEVEADYLGVTVAPEWRVDIGLVGAFAYGGPTAELSIRTRYGSSLAAAYQNPSDQVLSATAGGGVELRIPSTFAFRLEIRHVEGLSPAFTGDAGDFKHRSTEILVRVGRRNR